MTKRDYEALARALADAKPANPTNGELVTWAACCLGVARVLQADNPRFDHTRFLRATHGA